MEILPLGVGEAFAKTLFQTNYLVFPGDGEPFLVDFGYTAPRALVAHGIPMGSVTQVLVSHLHADHIGGLEELGFTGAFQWQRRARLHVPENLLPLLWDHCLSGGMGQCLRQADGSTREADMATYFAVTPVSPGAELAFGSVTVRPFATPHVPGRCSWGFHLRDRASGSSVMLSCDSCFDRANLETYGAGADAVFHDCQLRSNGAHIHATLDELLTLPDAWQRKILLVHYADDWQEFSGRTGSMRFGRQGERYRF
jgi:ribonuclease BN (tRNA processing enzyme)